MLGDGDGIGMAVQRGGRAALLVELGQAFAEGGGRHPAAAEIHMRRHIQRAGVDRLDGVRSASGLTPTARPSGCSDDAAEADAGPVAEIPVTRRPEASADSPVSKASGKPRMLERGIEGETVQPVAFSLRAQAQAQIGLPAS